MSNVINIQQLNLLSGLQSDNTYEWDLSQIMTNAAGYTKLRVRRIDLPYSWYLFPAIPLINSLTIAPTNILNGNFSTFTLPAALMACFGVTGVTIDAATNIITVTNGAPFTLFISQWGAATQYFLGSGSSDINSVANTIVFPYPVDLGGNREVFLEWGNGLTNEKQVCAPDDVNKNALRFPVDGNPFDIIYWEPEDYFLTVDNSTSFAGPTLAIKDEWGNILDLNHRQGYIQIELHPF